MIRQHFVSPHLSRWRRESTPQTKQVLAFPHAGGDTTAYASLAERLINHDIDLWCVRLPGRGARRQDPLPRSLTALSRQIWAEMCAFMDNPSLLIGQSMGAALAYETATQAGGAAQNFSLVALSAPSPWIINRRVDGPTVPPSIELAAELQNKTGNAHSEVEPFLQELEQLTKQVLLQDMRLLQAWRPKMTTLSSVRCFLGTSDRRLSVEDAYGWGSTSTRVSVECVDSDHLIVSSGSSRVPDSIVDAIVEEVARHARLV